MADSLDVLLGKRFIERKDVKAAQHDNGIYTPIREKWKMEDIRSHLDGSKTFGHYMVSPENKCKLFTFDIDLTKEGYWIPLEEEEILNGGQACNPREIWQDPTHPGREFLTMQLRCMAEGLAIRTSKITGGEFPIAIAYSGNKGLHVYGFTGSIPAREARLLAVEILESFNCFEPTRGQNFWVHKWGQYRNLEIEIFPKQDTLDEKDLGNLLRLPLGINRKSNQRGYFLDPRCGYNQLKELDPLAALSGDVQPWA